jgi:hypothetical protein
MTRRSLLPITILLAAACGDAKKPAAPAPAAAPVPVPAVDAVSEAAASYRIRAAVDPATLPVGKTGSFALEIEMARPDVHVQAEFPLKVALTSTPGLALAQSGLGHANAVDPAAKGRRWTVGLTARGAGPQGVTAEARFAICKESEPAWCVTRNETVTASVEVR